MKYIVILGDGMADEPIPELKNKTPLQIAKKPTIDNLTHQGELGLVNTIPKDLNPGSDTANLSVMGYDPYIYYTGRSPLEAISMGIKMKEADISFRCNLVTLTEKESSYGDKTIIDHSADEITTEEGMLLIQAIQEAFGDDLIKFYTGISYRHAMIWDGGSTEVDLTPPHDILERTIKDYLPKGRNADIISAMMSKSYDILKDHPVNISRKERGLNPANSIWIWGEGKRPSLDSFKDKYHLNGAMISAVDLLKGIGIAAKMTNIDVEGATGNIHTNFEGKADACIEALEDGHDFVYVHLEAPDECGHRGEIDNKVKSIELIDEKVVKRICDRLESKGVDYRMLILPDHPTPIALRTHTNKPVPYVIYDSTNPKAGNRTYCEEEAKLTGHEFSLGHQLMDYFLQK